MCTFIILFLSHSLFFKRRLSFVRACEKYPITWYGMAESCWGDCRNALLPLFYSILQSIFFSGNFLEFVICLKPHKECNMTVTLAGRFFHLAFLPSPYGPFIHSVIQYATPSNKSLHIRFNATPLSGRISRDYHVELCTNIVSPILSAHRHNSSKCVESSSWALTYVLTTWTH